VPNVQANVLAALAVRLIFEVVPLHIAAELAVVTLGLGLTVTVIAEDEPVHVAAVGVTLYTIVLATELLWSFKSWAIVEPEPALAPLTPELAPNVHVNVLAVLAVRTIFVVVPLQIVAELGVVTLGVGLTVTVIVDADPVHEPATDIGVTI
jgi:hypothetical protein